MAIFYCDLVSGNDANDGLTTATPKLTINGVTSLVTAYSDECRVRGMDSLFTDIGNWTWTNESRVVTITGNATASVAANDYICKTIVSSGTTVPEIYKVSTVAYNAGTDLTTITLLLTATYNYYVGTTETVSTSKLVLPTAIAAQTINKNGFVNGTATDVTGRQLTKITGGWNSDYSAQTTWTFLYGTVGSLFNFNAKTYWELSKFIIITTGNYAINKYSYCTVKDCFGGWCTSIALANTTSQYFYANNTVLIGSNSHLIGGIDDGETWDNCLMINSRSGDIIDNFYTAVNTPAKIKNSIIGLASNKYVYDLISYVDTTNSTILNVNHDMISSGYRALNFTGCTFQDIGTAANVPLSIFGNMVNCTFDMNRNRTTGYVNGSMYPLSEYYFTNNSGATGQFMRLNVNGRIYNTRRFKLYQTLTATTLKWYNTNNEDLGLSEFTSSSNYDSNQNNIIYNYTTGTTKNAILSKYGYTTLSDDYYTGKTGTTGATNSILHIVSTNNAACDFTSVDFVIDKTNSYNLSFYAKGSGSYTLHWNILNGGQYLYAWQTQAITSGAWQQITKAISASDWKMSGTATLVIRIPSQAKGTYALIDYIQLT